MLAREVDRMRSWRQRWKALLALAGVALLLHGVVLDGVAWRWRSPDSAPASLVVMRVRTLTPEPLAAPPPPATVPEPVRRVTAVRAPPVKVARPAPAAAPLVSLGSVASVGSVAPAATASAPAAAQPENYRTVVPSNVVLRYELLRGAQRGNGELQWQSSEDRYTLRFEGQVDGSKVLTQTSEGAFDAAGLAPLRFTEARAGRDLRAVNFQRAAGKLTFSGPTFEFPLVPGVQDRLSWLIQLAAVVAGEPSSRESGALVTLPIAGARGDFGPWLFRFDGIESVDLPQGPVAAAKYVREGQQAHDSHVEVWLDPARGYLPVRTRVRNGPDDEALEMRLQFSAQP